MTYEDFKHELWMMRISLRKFRRGVDVSLFETLRWRRQGLVPAWAALTLQGIPTPRERQRMNPLHVDAWADIGRHHKWAAQ